MPFALHNVGDLEALADIRKTMEEIGNQHVSLGFFDMLSSTHEQNFKAALESGNWVSKQMGPVPFVQGFMAYIHIMDGDYHKARQKLEIVEPRYWNRASWRAAIEKDSGLGCNIATTMLHTGDEEMAHDLLRTIITYMETELPNYLDDADRFVNIACYAAAGDYEKALDAFEVQVDHGHYQFWWSWTKFPALKPLHGNPRWESAMAKIHERNAQQRENLARIRAGTEL